MRVMGSTPSRQDTELWYARGELLERIITPDVTGLITQLHRDLEPARKELLEARCRNQIAYDHGAVPSYLPDSDAAKARGDWQIAPLPEDLLCRRVEITGPASDAKLVINMLSRNTEGLRADAAMLDFEDSMKPTWRNVLAGHSNLTRAVDGRLRHVQPTAPGRPAKIYRIDPDDMPLVMVRVRGLHLDEENVVCDGEPVCAGIVDLAISAFHTARRLLNAGRTPKYYVPKCEDHSEARWWNRLFTLTERALGLPRNSIRVTFLIETLPATFQMEEILYELRERAAGLNVGRWDRILSDIKVLRRHPDRILADRSSISMNRSWMRNYALRLVEVCHRHGALALGGMEAHTPGSNPAQRDKQREKLMEDKRLEADLGHDGCWISHPYFLGCALSAFQNRNQLDVIPEVPPQLDLLPQSDGIRTIQGLRTNVRVGIAYIKAWNEGVGCIAWDGVMEDLATFEISRAQTSQWLFHGVVLEDGTQVNRELVRHLFEEEFLRITSEVWSGRSDAPMSIALREITGYCRAKTEACRLFTESELRPFMTSRQNLPDAA